MFFNEKIFQLLKKKDPKFTFEIIVVDDGSKDKTSNVKFMFYFFK